MALLTGSIDAEWIADMTVSQVFMHIVYSPDNASKARHPLLLKLYEVRPSTPAFSFGSLFTDVLKDSVLLPMVSYLKQPTYSRHRPTSTLLSCWHSTRDLLLSDMSPVRRPVRPVLEPRELESRYAPVLASFLRRRAHILHTPPIRHGR